MALPIRENCAREIPRRRMPGRPHWILLPLHARLRRWKQRRRGRICLSRGPGPDHSVGNRPGVRRASCLFQAKRAGRSLRVGSLRGSHRACNVPDGTIVQLLRLNSNASSSTVLATTTTSAGRFSFNLTALGLQYAVDLIVRVTGPTGKQMCNFVLGPNTDINPYTETAFELSVLQLAGAPLNRYTMQELTDVVGAVVLYATVQNLGPVADFDQAVATIRTAVQGNASITGMLAAAADDGQTSQGPGDIGNSFPFSQGNVWEYQKTRVRWPGFDRHL